MRAEGRVMADNHRRFRWLVALSILAFAAWFLLNALEETIERAERQSVRLMLNQVRSALVVRGAEAMLAGDQTLASLEGLDPLPLLKATHEATAEKDCGQQGARDRGWCFDREHRWLIYHPAQPLELEGRRREPGEAFAWQVRVDHPENVKPGKINEKRATGLKLVEIDAHQVSENQ